MIQFLFSTTSVWASRHLPFRYCDYTRRTPGLIYTYLYIICIIFLKTRIYIYILTRTQTSCLHVDYIYCVNACVREGLSEASPDACTISLQIVYNIIRIFFLPRSNSSWNINIYIVTFLISSLFYLYVYIYMVPFPFSRKTKKTISIIILYIVLYVQQQ